MNAQHHSIVFVICLWLKDPCFTNIGALQLNTAYTCNCKNSKLIWKCVTVGKAWHINICFNLMTHFFGEYICEKVQTELLSPGYLLIISLNTRWYNGNLRSVVKFDFVLYDDNNIWQHTWVAFYNYITMYMWQCTGLGSLCMYVSIGHQIAC